MDKINYEWIVVGSGISGLISSEILTRQGHKTLLIEKNETLASETTRDFHEWMHFGSLFTLIPDNLLTLKYVLGAIDDLIEYYNCFDRMNIIPTEKGVKFENNGWFNGENNINFKFRVKNRKITFPWIFGIARSIFLINKIKSHDWLRRRAGVRSAFKYNFKEIFNIIFKLFKHEKKFYNLKTPDITMNSRIILNDLLNNSINNGLEVRNNCEFLDYKKVKGGYKVYTKDNTFFTKKILLCNAKNISKFIKADVKLSYAPMAVINNVNEKTESFVELDYFPKNCINILTKENGVGLIGGISFNDKSKCKAYINDVFNKHKKYDPNILKIKEYNGVKSEITIKNESRNYQYHIKEIEKDIWSIIPGKFTLGFSIGPEFYRRVYGKNPKKHFMIKDKKYKKHKFMSNPFWLDAIKNFEN